MDTTGNKQVLQTMLAPLADGESGPFLDGLADDVSWTVPGSNPTSNVYRGKDALINGLFAPSMAFFAQPYRVLTKRMIAEGDIVVVELQGAGNKTISGAPYEQAYCWVCRLEDGKVKEVIEYADTYLAVNAMTSAN